MEQDKLLKRIEKWDKVLNDIHENLRYLHEEFDEMYSAIAKIRQQEMMKKFEGK